MKDLKRWLNAPAAANDLFAGWRVHSIGGNWCMYIWTCGGRLSREVPWIYWEKLKSGCGGDVCPSMRMDVARAASLLQSMCNLLILVIFLSRIMAEKLNEIDDQSDEFVNTRLKLRIHSHYTSTAPCIRTFGGRQACLSSLDDF